MGLMGCEYFVLPVVVKVAYEALEEAWRIAWKFVERHECLELPEHLKQVQLTKDTKLVWAIVDQTGAIISHSGLLGPNQPANS
eukprot:684399-Amphidinium_carterae.1